MAKRVLPFSGCLLRFRGADNTHRRLLKQRQPENPIAFVRIKGLLPQWTSVGSPSRKHG
nr:hypothetical protein [uncultured Kingella sp.]